MPGLDRNTNEASLECLHFLLKDSEIITGPEAAAEQVGQIVVLVASGGV